MELIVIAHNIRSTHNVGALMRTAEGLGITRLYLSGYTPYPEIDTDPRLPHIKKKIDQQINKTALGAQHSLAWSQVNDVTELIKELRSNGYTIAGLEQTENSIVLSNFTPPEKFVLVLGSEVTGIDHELLSNMDYCLEIPMKGVKESFNVVEAASMTMFHCTNMV